ncbi:calcium/sodium antiporter [Candidatus Gracilibacteria bacterium 28_42_T64]|nr:calcium/sodium antiporter [Candidatus Gracilibacteria bacterium 28_42_T64]
MEYLFLIIGFILLIKGADMLVDGASSIAKKFGISALVIGLTIVAFGSSAPELVINLISGYSGNTDLAVSNIIGSNISNLLLILGITAILYPIKLPQTTIKREIPFLIFSAIVLILILLDGVISRADAGILSVLFGIFLYYTFSIAKSSKDSETEKIELMSNIKATLFVLLGLCGLVGGGKLIVDSAVGIAQAQGLPEAFIGVTIVAIGTSLPELAVSVIAAFKKNTDIAIGAVVGSNIFNTLWILGATGLMTPLPSYTGIHFDLGINLIASIYLFLFAFSFKKHHIDKKEGIIFITLYVFYIIFLVSKI